MAALTRRCSNLAMIATAAVVASSATYAWAQPLTPGSPVKTIEVPPAKQGAPKSSTEKMATPVPRDSRLKRDDLTRTVPEAPPKKP